MKPLFSFLLLILVLVASLAANAQHVHSPAGHDRPSIHGMAIFGKSKIYLNHLAMFHNPHNYQAIFEVEVSDPDLYEQVRLQTEVDRTPMTIVPEPFALDQMIKSPRPFKATLYMGHFERGGTAVSGNLVFTIKKVIYAQALPAPSTRVSTITFGEGDEIYLAHRIVRAPDIDHIVRVSDHAVIHHEEQDLTD